MCEQKSSAPMQAPWTTLYFQREVVCHEQTELQSSWDLKERSHLLQNWHYWISFVPLTSLLSSFAVIHSGNECFQGCKSYSTKGVNWCFLFLLGNRLSQLKSLDGERNGNVSRIVYIYRFYFQLCSSLGVGGITMHICIVFWTTSCKSFALITVVFRTKLS